MAEYANGNAMWASVSTPNKFGQYVIYLLTDEAEADRLEGMGLSRVRDKSGQEKYDQPAFKFAKRVANRDGATNPAPKLVDTDGNNLDTLVGNGLEAKDVNSAISKKASRWFIDKVESF